MSPFRSFNFLEVVPTPSLTDLFRLNTIAKLLEAYLDIKFHSSLINFLNRRDNEFFHKDTRYYLFLEAICFFNITILHLKSMKISSLKKL